ncbi:T9SS type A sorting domain-containing protein [bacterium]|nr:T9SS type A sorting domain-containing protein [bacterium]NIN92224.1 T9SS type A sorting domain-containing protein [bacterium]NIO18366.1 T9SS type A sorting domain-containing protein [bacterium]NIO73345.1 T9SS type A sorting domain-containing protein [bacterium]
MNYKTERFGKAETRLWIFLFLISIIIVSNFAILSARGEKDAEMFAFNACGEGLAPSRKSSLLGHGLPDRKFSATSGFRLDEGYPRPRVFTPNGDGSNEQVTFEYENINESSIVCWIYDIRGSVVRQLDIVETGENRFTWDGEDEEGNIVPSGIYIYHIEVEGQTINGTIVLAK